MTTSQDLIKEYHNKVMSCPDVSSWEVLHHMLCNKPSEIGIPMMRNGQKLVVREFSKFLVRALKEQDDV
jgi:hypothetical protein